MFQVPSEMNRNPSAQPGKIEIVVLSANNQAEDQRWSTPIQLRDPTLTSIYSFQERKGTRETL
jgi:hypothetical protein